MSTARPLVEHALRRVGAAAEAFESRWTLRALERVDGDLHCRLVRQQEDWHKALVTGTSQEMEAHTAAMCRGWVAATSVMENAGVDDDAYVLGYHAKTGTRVAIGEQKHAIKRVREVHGQNVIWITPDEVAAMVAGMEAVKDVKHLWPDAEVINLYPRELVIDAAG